ncbi:hypothetical protein T11_594 [Trichinella zimbabwensis]|uniref:Uncharacterized protein n=1 Tax=Trichinella zimbabwensis TaxID=268475 RepID=A0A0V1GZU2_9BILA|nr:hypothetical protein T11_594 [Trichinella zimbabwensis]
MCAETLRGRRGTISTNLKTQKSSTAMTMSPSTQKTHTHFINLKSMMSLERSGASNASDSLESAGDFLRWEQLWGLMYRN